MLDVVSSEKDAAGDRPRQKSAVPPKGRNLHVTLIGNFPPRRCGLATFTFDVFKALMETDLGARAPQISCDVIAMSDPSGEYDFADDVTLSIRQEVLADYAEAARFINQSASDLICVQHEYGIFGGPAGDYLLTLLDAVEQPVVTVLHTILTNPSSDQRRVLLRLAERSSRLIVMTKKGVEILRHTYGVPRAKIAVVPHGVPDHPLCDSDPFKSRFGLEDRDVLLTFGLLSPNKGIEGMIRALPRIAKVRPKALYVVLGATHPHVLASQGESYREQLIALAKELGVAGNIKFVNEYVDDELLIQYLAAADLYVTPYLNEAQITSGTLSYAVGLGKAVVSTRYWHAEELLADDRGVLVPFDDSDALADAAICLFTDDARRDRIRANAYAEGRHAIWSKLAESYATLFGAVRAETKITRQRGELRPEPIAPTVKGVKRLTDSVGIIQHCVFNVPDRSHGYCLDDNARALIFCLKMQKAGFNDPALDGMSAAYAAFMQHAWNPDRNRFRNFMSYDRRWLEEEGSEDSFGRAFWALGVAADIGGPLAPWAAKLSGAALPHAAECRYLRSRAFVMLGLASLLRAEPQMETAHLLLRRFAAALLEALHENSTADRLWFEPKLAYDNARLPEALLRAGLALNEPLYVEAGEHALRWLSRVHTGEAGCFRPIGSDSFTGDEAAPFDQQPLEVAAAIDACAVAFEATKDRFWVAEAQRAFGWFMGKNDLCVRLAEPELGICRDGLTREGANANTGAESVLAFQMACCAMHEFVRGARADSKAEMSAEPKSPIDQVSAAL